MAATPERLSVAESVALPAPWTAFVTGAVRSMLTAGVPREVALPATSVTVTVCVCPLPSWPNVTGLLGVVVATPEVASEVVQGMDTGAFSHPAALGAGEGTPIVSTGAVASILTA